MPHRFHWVVPQKLAGMSLPGWASPLDRDLAEVHSHGIRAIATLTEGGLDEKEVAAAGLTALHIPIDDFGVPEVEQVEEFCRFVDERLAAGQPVAAHCFAGLGRTGLMIACWLVREPGRTAEEVLAEIRLIQPGFVQTPQQEAFIAVWESEYRQRGAASG